MQRVLRSGLIQPKLQVNLPGDRFEQEADRVSQQVMEMGSGEKSPVTVGGRTSELRIQKECSECNGALTATRRETKIQRMCAHCEEEVQRKAGYTAEPAVSSLLEAQISTLRGGGEPLSPSARAFFEPRFGHSFGAVRVHTGGQAAQTADSVQARAYATGCDIVFARGQYAPESDSGKRLLAHELTHYIQQTGGGTGLPSMPAEPVMQRACGSAAIGTPTDCVLDTTDPVGDLALFTPNCDTFASATEQTKVEGFADSMAVGDRVRVHGFASMDGDATFNDNLSCARAVRARTVLLAKGIGAGQMDLLKHGATPGPAAQRRSVVLERTPGVSRPVVPQLTATIVPALGPGFCGDEDFVIQWSISRNSNISNGGFVIQDITRTFTDVDCTGAPIPRILGSGLRYFEAWQVNPGSTTFNPADGSTDTFNLTRGGPTCATGNQTFSGIATYHDGVGTLPAHMIRGNAATLAGGLRSSTTDPAIGGNVSRPVAHNLTFHWNCCPCSSSPTVVDSHTP